MHRGSKIVGSVFERFERGKIIPSPPCFFGWFGYLSVDPYPFEFGWIAAPELPYIILSSSTLKNLTMPGIKGILQFQLTSHITRHLRLYIMGYFSDIKTYEQRIDNMCILILKISTQNTKYIYTTINNLGQNNLSAHQFPRLCHRMHTSTGSRNA